ncbi:MAG: hemolysin family protein [Sedimentisphaerales bacterium]
MLIYGLIAIVIMLFFNAVFAAYEMGLASVSAARLQVLLDEKKRGSAEAVYMKSRMEASLAVIQLGMTLVGALAAATGGIGIEERLSPYLVETFRMPEFLASILSLVFLIIPFTFIVIVFVELVPKMLAMNNKELVVLRLSPFMKRLSVIADPVVSVIEAVVKWLVRIITKLSPAESRDRIHGFSDFRAAVSLARASKLLSAREEKIVLSSALLAKRPVKDILIPAQDITMIWMECSLMEALIKAHLDMHTRFPVCRNQDAPQSIEGYVNFKDIVYTLKASPAAPSLKSITRSINKINGDTSISQALEIMIQGKLHIALVVSGDGKISGMVTLEDILEELVGEIEDEFDYLPAHIQPCGSAWIMGGGLPMTRVFSTIGLKGEDNFKDSRVPTLSEWCIQKASHPLEGGEIIESDNIRVVVRKFRRKKVSEALVGLH